MRSFVIALVAVALLFAAFIGGVSAQSPGLMFAWLCLSPISYIALGYTLNTVRRERRIAAGKVN